VDVRIKPAQDDLGWFLREPPNRTAEYQKRARYRGLAMLPILLV
jgi:hypothetical protein